MRSILPASVASIAFALIYCASAGASPHRDDRVYQAAAANRAGALDLLREIVDIDSGTGDVAGGACSWRVDDGQAKALHTSITAKIRRRDDLISGSRK